MAISDNDRHEAYLRRKRASAFDVRTLITLPRDRLPFIGIVTLVCTMAGLAYISLTAPKYMSSGQILIGSSGSQATASDVASGSSGNSKIIETENRIDGIISRSVLDRVIARENLETDAAFGAKPRGMIATLLVGLGLAKAADPNTTALRQLERVLSVTGSPDFAVATVNAVTGNRDTSERLVNAVMDSYLEEENLTRTDAAKRPAAASDPQLETLRSRLRDAEQRYERYRSESRSDLANRPASEKPAVGLAAEIEAAEGRVTELHATLEQINRAKNDILELNVLPESLRGGKIEVLKNRYAVAKQTEVSLAATLGPRHPDLITAAMQTAEAKRLLEQAIRNMIQSTKAELESARSNVTSLRARLETSGKDTGRSNNTSVRLQELEHDVELSRAAYLAVANRSREQGDMQQSGSSGARIVSRATRPLEQAGTPAILILLASLLSGLGLGTVLLWLGDRLEDKGLLIGR